MYMIYTRYGRYMIYTRHGRYMIYTRYGRYMIYTRYVHRGVARAYAGIFLFTYRVYIMYLPAYISRKICIHYSMCTTYFYYIYISCIHLIIYTHISLYTYPYTYRVGTSIYIRLGELSRAGKRK